MEWHLQSVDIEMMPFELEVRFVGGQNWIGGLNYSINVAAMALNSHNVTHTIPVSINLNNIKLDREYKRIVSALQKKIEQVKISDPESRIKISFPIKDRVPQLSVNTVPLLWIPDFQYKKMPHMFSVDEIKERNERYKKLLDNDHVLVLSSDAMKREFRHFFPEFKSKRVEVMRFSAYWPENFANANIQKISKRLRIPQDYIYMPNQIFQHKGIENVLKALAIANRKGFGKLKIISTGHLKDYRNPDYNSKLKQTVKDLEIENNISFLGPVSRVEQYVLFQKASYVLQPSLYEGWSTSVEEAISLNKFVLLSDIDVHREQSPNKCIYFDTREPEMLSETLINLTEKFRYFSPHLMNQEMSQYAKHRTIAFSQNLREICQSVLR